jgi:hypothetical protein
MPIELEGINATKDYQKDSYNKIKLMGKKLKRSRPISHVQNTLTP